MMDLIQLLLPQQTAKAIEIPDEIQPGEEAASKEDNAAFIAVMSHFINEQEASEISPAILQQDKQVNSELEPMSQEEAVHCEPDDSVSTQPVAIHEPVLVTKAIDSKDNATENTASTPKELLSLAWFESDSFEPPLGKPAANINALQANSELRVPEVLRDKAETEDKDNSTSTEPPLMPLNLQITSLFLSEQPVAEMEIRQEEPELSALSVPEKSKLIKLDSAPPKVQQNEPKVELPIESDGTAFELAMSLNDENNSILTDLKEKDEDSISTLGSNVDKLPPMVKQMPVLMEKTVETKEGHRLDLSQNIASSDWSEQFNQQIVWLGQQKIKTAIIKLNPQELGPLEVKIDLVKDEAKLNIRTQTAEIGNLIEHAMPRLRDMMHNQGLNLSQVNIESDSNPRHSQQQDQREGLRQEHQAENSSGLEVNTLVKTSKGIIDYFA